MQHSVIRGITLSGPMNQRVWLPLGDRDLGLPWHHPLNKFLDPWSFRIQTDLLARTFQSGTATPNMEQTMNKHILSQQGPRKDLHNIEEVNITVEGGNVN